MTSKSREPGAPETAPIESRRTPAATPVGGTTPDEVIEEDGEGSVLDVPDFGAFSAEAARPTPLDDIAEVDRQKTPID